MRKPDFVIGGHDRPYMWRWWVIPRNRFFNIYLHKIMRDDDDRALHDHPWWNLSILLKGSYREVMPDLNACATPYTRIADLPVVVKLRKRGSVVFRRATASHRLEVATGPVWSLFITGPVLRRWGFHCPKGWRYYREFVATNDAGAVGLGCEDAPNESEGKQS